MRDEFSRAGVYILVGYQEGKTSQHAAYQTAPTSAANGVAEVAYIKPYGEGGKYKLNSAKPARSIGPIPYGLAKAGSVQGPRYTSYEKLIEAKTLVELF